MKKTAKYRCSGCNEMKNEKTNIFYRPWNKHERLNLRVCNIVGICKRCDCGMKKLGISRVENYVSFLLYTKR